MPTDILRIILPVYFLLYFLFLFVFKAIAIKKQIGKSPFIFSRMSWYFILMIVALTFYLIIFTFFPDYYPLLLPISILTHSIIQFIGMGLLVLSFIWIIIAQNQMRKSWRVGIDEQTKTELITNGVFSFSRNPIYLGMIASLIGLFLTTPNLFTLVLLILSCILIRVQIIFEENYLTKMHGQSFLDYKKDVRRLI